MLKVNDDAGANAQFEPVLCTDDSMNLLVAWGDQRNLGGMSLWIFGQLFNSRGMRIGTNVRMTDSLALAPVLPDLAYSSGQFRLSWSAWNASLRVYQTYWNALKVVPVTWGVMFSSIFDAGPGGTLLKSISWTVDGSANGTIQMRVRSGDNGGALENLSWHGPSDTAGYYTNPAEEQIGSFANTGRYMQYAAYFNGLNGQSPVLRAVSIVYANQDTIPPAKPGGLAATSGHHRVTLTWSSNHESDLAGYRVYGGLASGVYAGGAIGVVPAGVTSYVDYTTVPDTMYHYAISAFDSSYNESALSDDASAPPAVLSIYVKQGGSASVTDTVQIPLRGVNIGGVAGLTLKLSYDAAVLKVLEAKSGGATRRFAVGMTNVAGGSEVISLNSGRGITDDRGDLLTLVCAVISGHTGTTIIHCDSAAACNESMSLHPCTPPGDCRIAIGTLGVAGGPGSQLPATFRLYQNYPNPFNPATTIVYEVPRMAQISLTILDLLGRRVATLVNGIRTPGRFSVEWNAVRQASGVYFCRMQAGTFAMTTKLLLVR